MDKEENKSELWKNGHWKRVISELRKAGIEIKLENVDRIVREMSFDIRSKKHPEGCPLYSLTSPPKSCHPIKDLNCLLCACPHYNLDKPEGSCNINSLKGYYFHHSGLPSEGIWDCSNCTIGHSAYSARKFLEENMNWLRKLDESYK